MRTTKTTTIDLREVRAWTAEPPVFGEELLWGKSHAQGGKLRGQNPVAGGVLAPHTEGTAAKPGKEVSLTREVRG